MDVRKTALGVAAVVTDRRHLLMIQRAETVILPGTWCFPGGTLEEGESPRDALVREMDEELGLSVTPGAFLWRWARDDGGLEIQWWSARIAGGAIRPNPAEVSQAVWMTPDTIRRTPKVLPNNIQFLDFAEGAGLIS